MDIRMLQKFFMWCTIINGSLFVVSVIVCTFAADRIYRMHGRWFRLPRETFNAAIYSSLGFFKIVVLVFNAVPYIALLILG